MLKFFLFVLSICSIALADKSYWWDIEWVHAAPDGFNRPVIGINGKWPLPKIEANVGERITIFLNNKLGNESTSLHFHGLRQFGTSTMDGPSGVTQCPIPPGSSFTYSFVVDTPGTYWYHSHNKGQYPDGLRAPLIVHDKSSPYHGHYDKSYTLTVSDWWHQQSVDVIKFFQSTADFPPMTPIPDSPIMNDGESAVYAFEPGKTYKFRILNIGAYSSFFVNFQDHEMQVIGLDGTTTQSTTANTLYVGAAQRYEVLVTAKKNATSNFAILGMLDTSLFEGPFNGNPTVLGQMQYNKVFGNPAPYTGLPNSIMPPIDDTTIKPYDKEPLLGPVSKQYQLDFNLTLINGIPRAIINNVTYLAQKVPTLYTAISAPQQYKMNPTIYGVNSNPLLVEYGDIVEIVINNNIPFGHPWHLHGHQFQVVARSAPNAYLDGQRYDPSQADPIPMRRDVAGVQAGGYVVFRFKADNPGVQLFHCHIEWHVEAGLTATVIEAVDHLGGLSIPEDHKDACRAGGMAFQGNAAGNTQNWLDLTGANTQVPTVNEGALWTGSSNKVRKIRGTGQRV